MGYPITPTRQGAFVDDPPGLEPRPADSESAVLPDYTTGQCVRAGGLEPPVPLGRLLYRQLRLTVFASHALPLAMLPGQGSNLQSRINSPMVCRINRPGTKCTGRPNVRDNASRRARHAQASRQRRRTPEPVAHLGFEGLTHHADPRLGRGAVALETVARLACRHQVEPRVAAAARPR